MPKLNSIEVHVIAVVASIAAFVAGAHPGLTINHQTVLIVKALPAILTLVFALIALIVEIIHAVTKHQVTLASLSGYVKQAEPLVGQLVKSVESVVPHHTTVNVNTSGPVAPPVVTTSTTVPIPPASVTTP